MKIRKEDFRNGGERCSYIAFDALNAQYDRKVLARPKMKKERKKERRIKRREIVI